MSEAQPQDLLSLLESLPAVVWIWAVATVLLGVGTGFAAGVWYGRNSLRWAIDRGARQVARLFGLVLETLDTAQHACTVLHGAPQLRLNARQIELFETRRLRLLDSLTALADQHASSTAVSPRRDTARPAAALEVSWMRSPEDAATGLPDRTAFDHNIALLQDAVNQSGGEAGLLLVQLDRWPQLVRRIGMAQSLVLLRKVAGVLCRSIRDEDLLCRTGDETFAVLMPNVGPETGGHLAEAIRRTIRHYHFRLDETGPEILVTASFGFAATLPGEHPDLLCNRAGDALALSHRRGRNQLHIHDGADLSCAAV